MFQRPLSSALLLLAGFATVSPVRALGFGRVPESIPFAQPLDLSVPVQLGDTPGLTLLTIEAPGHRWQGHLVAGADKRPQNTVATTSERILEEMEGVVSLYEKLQK